MNKNSTYTDGQEESSLEALSIKNIKSELAISLRGSLAGHYKKLLEEGLLIDAKQYLENLSTSSESDILRYPEDGFIVIGLQSECGQYFPDW